VLASHSAPAQARTDWRLKVTAGPEYDSNALRNPSGNQRDFPVTPDFDLRMLAIGGVSHVSPDKEHYARGEYVVGGKLFLREADEDALINQLDASYQYRMDEYMLPGAELSFKDLTLYGSDRSYTMFTADAFSDFPLWKGGTVRAKGGWRAFFYRPDDNYSNMGAIAGVSVRQRATSRLGFSLSYEYQDRDYNGRIYRLVPDIAGAMKIIRTQSLREDGTHILSAGFDYHRGVLVSGGYTLLYNESDSVGETIFRHRAMLLLSAKPFWEIFVHAIGTLQFTTFVDGLFVSQQLFLEEDDENQNSLVIKISREIGHRVSAEMKYGLYVSEFSSEGLYFIRQVYFAGLSWKYD
jgi:hypothetical protein